MVQLVYLDETGAVGRGAAAQPLLRLVALVVDEQQVQPLAERMKAIAFEHLGWLPADFEWHGNELFSGRGHWAGKSPTELLAAFEAIIDLLEELSLSVVYSSINKAALHARYGGAYDENAYVLALQFLLEKLDRWSTADSLRILVADEAKQEQVKAISLVRDLQQWSAGVVPGRQLKTVIDSMHFVNSQHSPGVQMADMVAFVIQRAARATQPHPNVTASFARMRSIVADRTPTWRQTWPHGG